MLLRPGPRRSVAIAALVFCAALPLSPSYFPTPQTAGNQKETTAPWTGAEAVSAADFVREISGAKGAASPTILYVGFRTLFEGGHVPGAVFHGTAATEKGLAELKEWLSGLPRTTNLVLYCGCCPLERCPNIRPAYKTARDLGFTRVRVLVLPTSFAADWVEKHYPMEKGL